MNGTEQNNYAEAGNTGAYGSVQDATGAPQGAYTNVPPAGAVPPGADPYAAYSAGTYGPGYGYVPAPTPPPGAPNPGLATLLGFIPGVGAMYNGQFAKGLAHIVIFSILTSLSSHAHEPMDMIFGLLTGGWFFYMVFDAYQTARARRDGLVAPDPFGLNNIGERFGMTSNPNWNDFVARPAAGTAAAGAPGEPVAQPYAPVDPAANVSAYGAPVAGGYGAGGYGAAGYGAPGASAYSAGYPGAYSVPPQAPYATPVDPYAAAPGTVPPPYSSPYASTYAPVDPRQGMPPLPPARFGVPTGAIWLIGLGLLALLGSLRHNFYWSGRFFASFVLLAVGAVLLVQRTMAARAAYPQGTPGSTWAQLNAARAGIIVLTVGVLQLLNDFRVATWHWTWPYLLIAIGLYQLASRATYNRMMAETPVPPYAGAPYSAPVAAAPAAAPATTATTEPISTEGEVR